MAPVHLSFAVSFSEPPPSGPLFSDHLTVCISISCKFVFVKGPYIKSSKSYSQGQKIIL